jgi:hypothetical protein
MIKRKEFGVAYWTNGSVWYETPSRLPVEVLYVHFMGNKKWWHWLFLDSKITNASFHLFSPIGYGLITGSKDFRSPMYILIRLFQMTLDKVKTTSGAFLRRFLAPSMFMRVRRLTIRSGRYH